MKGSLTMPEKIDNVLSWATDVDEATLEQAKRISRMPFIVNHVALMPDAHLGKGATVGSVIATHGAIIPAAIGVDIGCGMIAAQTNLTSHNLPDSLDRLHGRIARSIPAGVGAGHDIPTYAFPPRPAEPTRAWKTGMWEKALSQMGSLGSGNHFVEVCLDEADKVWIVLHSGSRGVGNQLATAHIDKAKRLMKDWFINLEDSDLAYLVQGTPEFDEYIRDMLWAQDYAAHNREVMMDLVLHEMANELLFGVVVEDRINCHHNFTQQEHHHGRNVWLTRKGAIQADEGHRGVIPGSMGTRSYIVRGLGNPASFNSCSHGAGRRLSRTRANKELSFESLAKAMEGKAWNHSKALVDEHPDAYKDIDAVMEAQKDLVVIEHTLSQVLNYKGT